MDMNLRKLWEIVKDGEAWHAWGQSMGSQRVGHNLATEQQNLIYTMNKQGLTGTGNYIQYPVKNHNGKEYKKL